MGWETLRTEESAVRTVGVEDLTGSKCSTTPSRSRGAILAQARKNRLAK